MNTIGKLIIVITCILLLVNVVYSAKTIVVQETDLVKLELEANDVDGDNLTYNFSEPLDEKGEWQTDYGDEGEYKVLITVSDGQNEAKDYVLIIVNHKNRPPVIQEIENLTFFETDTVKIEPVATDYENDSIKLNISEPVGNDCEWETGYEDAGEYPVTITASDGKNTVTKEIILIVKNLDRAPQISSKTPEDDEIEIKETENATFSVSAEDADGNELSYSWFVDGIETKNKERTFEYSADYNSAGEHKISAVAGDGEKTEQAEWTVNVINVDRAPVIKSAPKDITAKEGEKIEIKFSASDPDGDALRYQVSEPVGNDLLWETAYGDAGEYNITLTVSDGELNATSGFKIVVENVDRAPLFNTIKDITISEGDVLEIEFNATDPDGQEVAFETRKSPEGALLEGNKFSYSPGYDVVKHSSGNLITGSFFSNGEREFTVKMLAVAEGLSTEQKFTIIVQDKNRAPVLGEIEDSLEMNEGDSIVITPSCSDPDGDKVTVHISDPLGDDGEWQSDYNSSGEYPIAVVATDGSLETVQNLTITVNNVNRAPYFEDKMNLFEVNENETVEITPAVKDLDGGVVELTAENLPNSSSFKDGKFSWTPDYDAVKGKDSEKITIKFIASDEENLTAVESFDIVVKNVNRAPEILNATQSASKVYVGESILFTLDVFDPDGDELEYYWNYKILDSEKDGSALKRTFTVPGCKEITVTVSDGFNETEHVFKANVYENKTAEAPEAKETKPASAPKQKAAVQQIVQPQKPQPSTAQIVRVVMEDEEPASEANATEDSGFVVSAI